ncbi:hypothetical protein HA402_008324 [Bradysia odoriphaga]|nr:hypothetical protein HA402_008324 [Bradysia odoriphaga]
MVMNYLITFGKSYDIFSPEQNRNGIFNREGMDCRWAAEAPAGHILVLDCDEVYMPLSNNCNDARIEVSASGETNLSDANRYCGTKSFRTQSVGNRMVIAFKPFSSLNALFGSFFRCRLTSTADIVFPCECGKRKKVCDVDQIWLLIHSKERKENVRVIFCGATIIDKSYAITAAHCVMKRDVQDLALLVGDHDYRTGNETKFAALYRLSRTVIHPDYRPQDDKNDIALVQTARPMNFNEAVGPALILTQIQTILLSSERSQALFITWQSDPFAFRQLPFIIVLLNVCGLSQAYFEACDTTINVAAGQTISVQSPGYSAGYGYAPGSSCRYTIVAPSEYQVRATCSINLYDPSNGSCSSERFYFATDGKTDLSTSVYYCGSKTVGLTSQGNKMVLAYISTVNNGIFDCSITTVCDCGWSVSSRIVGGTTAGVNEFTPMAALVSTTTYTIYCGAAIVSSKYCRNCRPLSESYYYFQHCDPGWRT